MLIEETDVLIVGAGPTGLAASIELKRQGVARVLVVDREEEAGGVPRFCHHVGFGIWDRRRLYSGPAYAFRYRQEALKSGVRLLTSTTVTDWLDTRDVAFTSPKGLGQIEARAILLATGCRERPRAARLVPGSRPNGIFTTGSLQRFVYEQGLPVGKRALIVGAELVSLSALTTLLHAGVKSVAMITELPGHQIHMPYLPAKWFYADVRTRTPILTGLRLVRVYGRQRVEGVELADVESDRRQTVECDTLVFTGDWVPENELARRGKLAIDGGTSGPQIDSSYRTSSPGVFAAGNLLHGAETADASALEGRRTAGKIAHYLNEGQWPKEHLTVCVESPLSWVYPNTVAAEELPRHAGGRFTFYFRVNEFLRHASLAVLQDDRYLFSQKFRFLGPGKSYRLVGTWPGIVTPDQGPLHVRLLANAPQNT